MLKHLLFASLVLVAAEPALAQDYPLLCRGPLKLTAQPGVTALSAEGRRNRSAAGSEGEGLSPGTCAWVDRPLNAQESPVIGVGVFEYENSALSDDQYTNKAVMHFTFATEFTAYRAGLLGQFAGRSDYVIKRTGHVIEFIPVRQPGTLSVPDLPLPQDR